MASLSSRFCTVRNGVASRVCHAMMEAKRITCKGAAATCTALSSRKTATGILRSATAPAALLRTSAVCCTACQDADIVEIQLKIEGMVCDGCSSRVLEALQQFPGVKSVLVDLEKGIASVELTAATQTDAFNELPKLIETVTELGFEAQPYFE